MKVVACGGRRYDNEAFVWGCLDMIRRKHPGMVLFHGAAKGADSLAARWAIHRGVSVFPFPADWELHGRQAGPIRNGEMLDMGAKAVVAFPGGHGTADMVRQAKFRAIPVWDLREAQGA